MQQDREQRRVLGAPDLVDEVLAVPQDPLEVQGVRGHAVAYAGLELVGVLPVEGRDLQQCVLKVLHHHTDLAHVLALGEVAHVDLPVQGEGRGRADEAFDLRARKVLRAGGERRDGDRAVQVALLSHVFSVDVEDLHSPALIGKADLHMHFKTPWPQQRLVDEVHAIRHADEEDVVERVHAIDLRQQLVYDAVVHARAVLSGAAGLADGVDLVKDDHVQLGALTLHLVLLLCIRKEVSDVLFRLAHILVQDFRSVDDLRFSGLEELGKLPGDEGLARARRPVEQHASDVVDAEIPHDAGRERPRREGAPEDVAELLGEAADAELLEVEVRPEDAAVLHLVAQHVQLPRGPLLEVELRHRAEHARGDLGRGSAVAEVDGHEAQHGQLQHLPLDVQDERLRGRQDLLLKPLTEDRLNLLILYLYSWVLGCGLHKEVYLALARPQIKSWWRDKLFHKHVHAHTNSRIFALHLPERYVPWGDTAVNF
mmetsp:Transcript_21941/g.62281  ORF Transcript_21941/g.62281 Transcript_21941/m.62281 type:complete len:483 (+) Transcript_21941:867-2315(+)